MSIKPNEMQKRERRIYLETVANVAQDTINTLDHASKSFASHKVKGYTKEELATLEPKEKIIAAKTLASASNYYKKLLSDFKKRNNVKTKKLVKV